MAWEDSPGEEIRGVRCAVDRVGRRKEGGRVNHLTNQPGSLRPRAGSAETDVLSVLCICRIDSDSAFDAGGDRPVGRIENVKLGGGKESNRIRR